MHPLSSLPTLCLPLEGWGYLCRMGWASVMGQGHLLTFGTSLVLFGYPETLTQLLLQRSGLSKQGQSTRQLLAIPV